MTNPYSHGPGQKYTSSMYGVPDPARNAEAFPRSNPIGIPPPVVTTGNIAKEFFETVKRGNLAEIKNFISSQQNNTSSI